MAGRTQTNDTRKERIVLLDTHAILHRAFHALPEFTSPKGEPTGALYGLVAFLFKVISELKPDHIFAAFDLPEPTHRHEAFAEYKATRVKADDALIAQIERARDVLAALGVPLLEAPGFEADDILGTLADKFKDKKSVDLIIASGDMDTLQLVDDAHVRVYTLKRGLNDTILYDSNAVIARYGFGPELIPDYKGLRGDPSDNIPGIRGIGEKTATQLIVSFGSLDALYKTLKSNPEKFKDAGIKERITSLLAEGEDDARFSKELATIRTDAPIELPSRAAPWREHVDSARALSLLEELGFRTLSARFRTLVGTEEASSLASEGAPENKEPDARALQETALALWLLRSDITNPSLEDMLEYSGARTFEEARATILKNLHKEKLERVFEDIELPLIPVVQKMEARGILLDTKYLSALSRRYHEDLDDIARKIFQTAGEEFNLNSPKQLGEVLYEKMRIDAGKAKRTATGQRSTRENELQKYANDHPIVADILEYRELQKLLSTYIDNLPNMVDGAGRLHARFSQAGTTTGRMSSQSPNMQNIPIKTTRGAAIRKAIIAPEGYTLLAADYSQIELRVAAFLSGDEKLIEYFKTGQDIHTAVAAQVFDVPPEHVDKEMRRRAKAINFGILYGMGANALAAATSTTRKEAEQYLAEYFKRFSGIARYVEAIKAEVHSRGYTETWFGRRRYFEGATSPLPHIVAAAERMALNAPIQGTQADIIKIAMARIDERIRNEKLGERVHLVCQVHDELLYEVETPLLARATALVREVMESVLPLKDTRGVPLAVDCEAGPNYGELTPQ